MSDYFSTNWSAMTTNDWIGLIITAVILLLMIIAYVKVFRPKNKDKLEKHKFIVMDN
jgi:cytochrome c oxidase cbb3-type subunit IV